MSKVAILTDSNSGITQAEAKQLGIYVLPMPFYINKETYYEDITLTQEQFFEKLKGGWEIATSTPVLSDITDMWDKILEEYDQLIFIPMSSGLSSTYQASAMLAEDYEGKVFVLDMQRISVTMRQATMDAMELIRQGRSAEEACEILMAHKMESAIYIMVDTLFYLKKGGRVTPAAATFAELLKIKPVLQIQGEKLDAFAKARSVKAAKKTMIKQIKEDSEKRFGDASGENCWIDMAYTYDLEAAEEFKKEVQEAFPNHTIVMNPLSLSVSCHIGPGALAVTITKKLDECPTRTILGAK